MFSILTQFFAQHFFFPLNNFLSPTKKHTHNPFTMTDPMDSITNSIMSNISSSKPYQRRPQQYPTKYRTGVDFRGLDWSQIPTSFGKSKTIWKVQDDKFLQKVSVKFDEMVRRYSLYTHKLGKNGGGGYKNFNNFEEMKKKDGESQQNKMMVMSGEGDDRIEMLNNEFVLEVKVEGEISEDVLDWKVDVADSLDDEKESLITFSNEVYCTLVNEIFGKEWELQHIDMYNPNLATCEVKNVDSGNSKARITYRDKIYYVYEKYDKIMAKNDVTKNNMFYKFNSKYNVMQPTKVLVLLNMVSLYDLKNEEKFTKIQNSLNSQKNNLLKGAKNIVIPRPGIDMIFNDSDEYYKNGLTKVYIEFETVEESIQAFENLDDWYFQDRKVLLSFYNEKDFKRGIYI